MSLQRRKLDEVSADFSVLTRRRQPLAEHPIHTEES